MKKLFYFVVASFIVSSGCAPAVVIHTPPQEETESAPEPVTYQKFYDELSPYGRWINYPDEGYVWSPNVDPGFRPYATNGHWVYSDEGWTWVSDFSWGWAPFHYGNWFYEDGNGWLWLPGTQWAPAWVTWGQSGSYYGWAPIPPHIDVNRGWTPPQDAWTFVPRQHITKPRVSNYIVDKSTNVTIVKNVTIINNIHNNNTTVINNTTNNNNVNNTKINNTSINNVTTNNSNVNNTKINNTATTNVTTNNNTNNTKVNNAATSTVTTNNNVTSNTSNNRIVNNTTLNDIKNIHSATIVNRGPQPMEVAKVTNTQVSKVNINEHNQPVKATVTSTNKLIMYRPVVRAPAQQMNEPKPIPQKVEPYNKPVINKR